MKQHMKKEKYNCGGSRKDIIRNKKNYIRGDL